MTDIVSRLRQELPYHADSFAEMNDLRFEAADHIERLEAALEFYADEKNWQDGGFQEVTSEHDSLRSFEHTSSSVENDQGKVARNTLNGGKDGQ